MIRRHPLTARRRNPYVASQQPSNIDLVEGLRQALGDKGLMKGPVRPVSTTTDAYEIGLFGVRVLKRLPISEDKRKPNGPTHAMVPVAGGLHEKLGGPADANQTYKFRMPGSTANWEGRGWEILRALSADGAPLVDTNGVPYAFQSLAPCDPKYGYPDGSGVWQAIFNRLESGEVTNEELAGAVLAFNATKDTVLKVLNGAVSKDEAKAKINNFLRIALICVFGTAEAAGINQLERAAKMTVPGRGAGGRAALSPADVLDDMGVRQVPAPVQHEAPAPVIPLPAYVAPAAPAAAPAPSAAAVAAGVTLEQKLEAMRLAKEFGLTGAELRQFLGIIG
jgi:hypothetical protein